MFYESRFLLIHPHETMIDSTYAPRMCVCVCIHVYVAEKLGEDRLSNEFGESKEFVKSVVEALKGKTNCSNNLLNFLEEAHRLGDSTYEYGTGWGKNVSIIDLISLTTSF